MYDALCTEWARCPPVHRLVASFIGHEPPQASAPTAADDGLPWVPPGTSLPASDAFKAATTQAEAIAAAERMFFGEVKDAQL